MPDDKLTATLAEIRERCDAATPGPWWSDQDERLYRLHGVAFRIPPQADGVIPEQVVNKQIAKAPKSGTPYAEYWPDAADDEFITHARTDVPRLLAALEAVLALHQPGRIVVLGRVCKTHEAYPYFSITAIEADRVRDCPDCKATVCVTCTCGSGAFGQCPTRVTIGAALLGEEAAPDAP